MGVLTSSLRTRELRTVLEQLDTPEFSDEVHRVARYVAATLRGGRRVRIAGNGGSAADAQHIAAEFQAWFTDRDRPPYDVEALTANAATLTAIANDAAYTQVFARQVLLLSPGDLLIALSTSGTSPNILAALDAASERGVTTVFITGRVATATSFIVPPPNVWLRIPSTSVPRIQEATLHVLHTITELCEALLPSPESPE